MSFKKAEIRCCEFGGDIMSARLTGISKVCSADFSPHFKSGLKSALRTVYEPFVLLIDRNAASASD